MLEMKLFNDNSEDITYNFDDFTVRAKEALLSDYPKMSATNHWHEDFEFLIILKGKMSYSVNGKTHELKEGQAIFVNSKQMHYGYSSDGTDCSFICILLHPSLISNSRRIKKYFLDEICKDTTHPFYIFDSSIMWQRQFIEMLSNIYGLCNDESEGFELQIMSIFYSICYSLYQNVHKDKANQENYISKNIEAMHNMVGYIQNNYQYKITLNDIASSGNVCRSSCCEIFQELLNKSPIYYLNEYRLEKSIEMLKNPLYSVTEIALQCGFNSSSYFTKMFNRELGCTPSQYRKKNK